MATKAFQGVRQQNDQLDTHLEVVGTTAATNTVYNTTSDSITIKPQTTTPSGYIRVTINATDYQIPIYAA
jgi:hypothetical protein